MNIGNDFKEFAKSKLGVNEYDFKCWEDIQNRIYGPSASLTPYVLEERELRVTQIDIFSRMMMDRIIWLAGPVNDRMSTVVQAQLMFLDELEEKDITLHIDSPGGSVKSGLSIVDVMNYVNSDISTINTGMAASMGSILLGAGTKGKRFSLQNSRVMLHQVSTGASGNIQDVQLALEEGVKYNNLLFGLLGEYTGKDPKQVMKDADRDLWMSGEEAVAYGLVDKIIQAKPKKKK